jgi:hypothetical protein
LLLLGQAALYLFAFVDGLVLTFEPAKRAFAVVQPTISQVYRLTVGTVLLLTIVAFLIWLHGAFVRVRLLASHRGVSAGWAVASWFVPILNLWKPLVALRELWQSSSRTAEGMSARAPSYLWLWWSGWLWFWGWYLAIDVVSVFADDVQSLLQWLAWPTLLVCAACALLGRGFVGDITAMQRELLGVD